MSNGPFIKEEIGIMPFTKKTVECPFPKVFLLNWKKETFFMQLAYNEAINAWNDDEVQLEP